MIEIQRGAQFSLVSSHSMTESFWESAARPFAHLVHLSVLLGIFPVSLSFHLSDLVHPKINPQGIAWEAWACVSRAQLLLHLETTVLPSLLTLLLCIMLSSEEVRSGNQHLLSLFIPPGPAGSSYLCFFCGQEHFSRVFCKPVFWFYPFSASKGEREM